ncbi:MAG: hypothetical protein M3Y22_00825, partial [Pseudomonadota bacterium]|nr:hypothetical protein [Pseudomonadota bacterium]
MLASGTTALSQTPGGFLVDRHGPRRFLIGGALLMSPSIAAMGLASPFWQILSAKQPAFLIMIGGPVAGTRGRQRRPHRGNNLCR